MKFATTSLIAVGLIASFGANAQTITINPTPQRIDGLLRDDAPSKKSPTTMRIETSMSFSISGPTGTVEEIRAKSDSARKAIYEMASSECAALTEVFKMECRLVNVRSTSQVERRNQGGDGVQANGSATYELTHQN